MTDYKPTLTPDNSAKLEVGNSVGPIWTASVFVSIGIPLNFLLAHESLFKSFELPGLSEVSGPVVVGMCLGMALFMAIQFYTYIRHPIRAIIDARGLSLIGEKEIVPWERVEKLYLSGTDLIVLLDEPLLRLRRRRGRYWVPACSARERAHFETMVVRFKPEAAKNKA